MYTRPEGGRRRVLITAGTRNLVLDTGSSLRRLVDDLTGAGAEVLIAALPEAAERHGPELGDVRLGWIPLDVVAPTCDLAVHHGGATTAMTLINAGVPQLIVPDNGYGKAVAQAVSGYGAAVLVDRGRPLPGQDPDDAVVAGCRTVLADPGTPNAAGPSPRRPPRCPPPTRCCATSRPWPPADRAHTPTDHAKSPWNRRRRSSAVPGRLRVAGRDGRAVRPAPPAWARSRREWAASRSPWR